MSNPPTVPGSSAPLPRGLRAFLFLASGVAGAAVMVVEILGARMLAPWVGTSHFVWTAQIGVTLAALACGYALGAVFADRGARPGALFAGYLGAALWLCAAVLLKGPVLDGLLALPLPAASLLGSAALFFVPLVLLAMTGPFLVRALAATLATAGGTAGRLSAVSTVGSFAGTAAVGYLLIPLLPTSVILLGTAGSVALLSVVYVAGWAFRPRAAAAAALLVAAGAGLGAAGLATDGLRANGLTELYRRPSGFGLIQVVQQRGGATRYVLNDYLVQNSYDTVQRRSTSMFTYMLEGLARAYAPRLDDVLCIGMGVGIVPRDLAAGGARVDVVEINPAVVPVAAKYFDLDTSAISITIADARTCLRAAPRAYDAVVLDAFLGDSVPTHLLSREAFAAMRRALKPGGVLVINTFVDVTDRRDIFGTCLWKTLAEVFPSVVAHGAKGSNTLFVASDRDGLAPLREPDYSEVHTQALAEVREAWGRSWEPDLTAGQVLTDDDNPLEYLDAARRETFRRLLAKAMRGA